MAFLLRNVSRSAEGRDIVRTSRVEGERLTVGRDPACDVRLTDLAVALRHATVERTGSRLMVRAAEGLSVTLDGRRTASADIHLGTGGDLVIARHVLRFMPAAPDADDVSVEIERITEGERKLGKSTERLFTLTPVMPGKRVLAWLLALTVLAVGLGWPIKTFYDRQQREEKFARFHGDQLWSTGSLSAGHKALGQNCNACHVKPFEAVRDLACKTCHTNVHDHADPFRLARARPDLTRWQRVELAFKEKFDIPAARCVDCHTEHEGPQEMPATAQRFCSDCHSGLKGKLPDTRLGNAGDFETAHPEFQPAVIAGWQGPRPQLRRTSLAQNPRELSNLKFPHDLHLSRSGGPAQMARRLGAQYGFGKALECKDCHDPTPDGTRFQAVDMEEDCAMCHSLAFDRSGDTVRTLRHGDPAQVIADLRDFHRGRSPRPPPSLAPGARRRPGDANLAGARIQFARGSGGGAEGAIRAAFSPKGACFDCHQVIRPPAGSLAFRITPVAFPVRYMHKGWFDHRPHETQSCSSCHAAERSGLASDLLIPGIATCRTCHGGESTSKPVPSSCAMCHDYHMDGAAPEMLVRQQVRGKKRNAAPGRGGR